MTIWVTEQLASSYAYPGEYVNIFLGQSENEMSSRPFTSQN